MRNVLFGLTIYLVIFLIAAAIQFLFSAKVRKLRFLPIGAVGCGLVYCAVLFLPRGLKPDPYFEDMYFSLVLMTVFLTCAAGCLVGNLVCGAVKNKKTADG